MKHKHTNNIIAHITLIIASIFAVFPLLWIVSASFKFKKDIFTDTIELFPKHYTLSNYYYIFTSDNCIFLKWLFNSVIIAAATAVFSAVIASFAAYAISQIRFAGRRAALYSFLITQMFPGAILIVPLYALFRDFGLFNSYTGLIIAYSTTAIPFCIWMLKSFFDAIPLDIIEAGRIDGLNSFGIYWRIALPLALPGIAVAAFFAFITAWNEFMFAFTFITKKEFYTIPVGLKTYLSQFDASWHYLSAGAVIVTIPAIFLFMLAQKKIVSGITAGGVKG